MMHGKRIAWLSVTTFVLLVAVLFTVRWIRVRAREETPLLSERAVVVRVESVVHGRVERTMTLEGEVRAAVSTDLAPEVTAQVVERLADPGDEVRRGQTLLRLDDAPFEKEVLAEEAELAGARANVEAAAQEAAFQESVSHRDRVLFEGGAISREALERSEAALVRAKAAESAARMRFRAIEEALHGARDRLEKTRITAPWPGAVVKIAVSPGDLAQVGRPVVRLVRDGAYRVVAQLPQQAGTAAHPGGRVWVASGGERIATSVSRVAAGFDRSGLKSIEVDFEEPPFGLEDGASLKLILVTASQEGMTLPRGALLEGSGGTHVFRVRDGIIEPSPVQVLLTGDRRALVEGKLHEGDRVVVEHPSILMTLSEGMAVRPLDQGREGGL